MSLNLVKKYLNIQQMIKKNTNLTGLESSCCVVSKGRTVEMIVDFIKTCEAIEPQQAYYFGENYAQELMAKWPMVLEQLASIQHKIAVDFIGHLQSNKIKKLMPLCKGFQTLTHLDHFKYFVNSPHRLLLQVNIDGSGVKNGIDVYSVVDFLNSPYKEAVAGFMTILDADSNPYDYYQRLFDLKLTCEANYNRPFLLSMGMSNDYEVAIKAGSNIVRVGRAIWEAV